MFSSLFKNVRRSRTSPLSNEPDILKNPSDERAATLTEKQKQKEDDREHADQDARHPAPGSVGTDEAPPTYSRPRAYAPELESLIAMARSTVAYVQDSLVSPPTQFEVDRLRNLLIYTLVIDYEVKMPDVFLSAGDNDFYLELSRLLHSLEKQMEHVLLNEEEKETLGAYLWNKLHAPSRALGLPCDFVLMAIHHFGEHRAIRGDYKGSLWPMAHSRGMKHLALKIYFDRKIMIPALATSKDMATALLNALDRRQKCWFQSLDGFDSSTFLDPENMDSEGNFLGKVHTVNMPSWELTERAKEFEERRARAVSRAPPLEAIQDCLDGLKLRAQREKARLLNSGERATERPKVSPKTGPEDIFFGDAGIVNPLFWLEKPSLSASKL